MMSWSIRRKWAACPSAPPGVSSPEAPRAANPGLTPVHKSGLPYDEHPGDEQSASVTVLRLGGGLFFATGDALEDRMREVALSPGITGSSSIAGKWDFIDSQGSAEMNEILTLAEQAGLNLRLARLKPAVREVLARDGVLGRIGDGNIRTAGLPMLPPASSMSA
jgi:sulfate permease, SulP family